MLRYILRRVLIAVPTLILVSVFVFTLQKLLPGDPVLAMASTGSPGSSFCKVNTKTDTRISVGTAISTRRRM